MAARLLTHRYDDGALTLHMADQASPNSRLEAVVLKITVTSPLPGVLRVQAVHFSRTGKGKVVFPLDYEAKAPMYLWKRLRMHFSFPAAASGCG